MTQPSEEWGIEFFSNDSDESSPVIDFIKKLPKQEQVQILNSLRKLKEFGIRLNYPDARALKGHKPLWELRPIPHRLIYVAMKGRKFVILHAFTKKKQKTPEREIEKAERRYAILLEREEKT